MRTCIATTALAAAALAPAAAGQVVEVGGFSATDTQDFEGFPDTPFLIIFDQLRCSRASAG